MEESENHALDVFRQRLHRWYASYGRRDLPWRHTRDAYAILVSEIMLQQTQVRTVLERFYGPFLSRFPTLHALAQAPQDDVLAAWQGLGYYSRALNLHRSARSCRDGLPATVEGLLALPGIGRNTAHAIAAFAYRQPYAVMEANVRRVISRIFALEMPKEEELWEKAAQLLDRREPFDYNQAMMDLGATVCTRRAPACVACPAEELCRGKGEPERYPAPKKNRSVPLRKACIWVLRNSQGAYYVTARKERLLQGLYRFPQSEEKEDSVSVGARHYARGKAHMLGRIRQQYSHFTLEAEVLLLQAGRAGGADWYAPDALCALPMSIAEHKVLALLGLSSGNSAFPHATQQQKMTLSC